MPTLAGRILRNAADVVDDPRAALRAGVARFLSAVRASRVEEPQRVLPLGSRRLRPRSVAPHAAAAQVAPTPNGDPDAD